MLGKIFFYKFQNGSAYRDDDPKEKDEEDGETGESGRLEPEPEVVVQPRHLKPFFAVRVAIEVVLVLEGRPRFLRPENRDNDHQWYDVSDDDGRNAEKVQRKLLNGIMVNFFSHLL